MNSFIFLTAAKEGFIIDFGSIFTQELIMQLVNTGILAIVLTYLLYDPVKQFLQKRADRIKNQIETAEKDLKSANTLKAEYEMKLREVEKESAKILDDARKRATEREAQIIEEAKAEAEAIKSRALLDVEREKEQAKDEMKAQIIEISTLMTSKYLKNNMDTETQNKLLNEVIEELEDVKWLG